jgi:Family of unknown function (DUF6011)
MPEKIVVLNKSKFEIIQNQINNTKYGELQSYFTDIEAKKICFKLNNKRIRKISELFQPNNYEDNQDDIRYQLHYLANKALDIYGGQILTFIYDLPQWYNAKRDTVIMQMDNFDLHNSSPRFPNLYLQSNSNSSKQYEISFKKVYERPIYSSVAFTFRNKETKKEVDINYSGEIVENVTEIEPIILLFKEIINGEVVLASGYDEGYCDKCGRELTDYYSILYGRGPTCRLNYGTN